MVEQDFKGTMWETIFSEEYLTDEYFYKVSTSKTQDFEVNPIEDYFIVKLFLTDYSAQHIANFLKRSLKCIQLRLRILLNSDGLTYSQDFALYHPLHLPVYHPLHLPVYHPLHLPVYHPPILPFYHDAKLKALFISKFHEKAVMYYKFCLERKWIWDVVEVFEQVFEGLNINDEETLNPLMNNNG